MSENSQNIKRNTRILLARNSPVALVVGAASFFGSHLVDKLLSLDIQVIGVDSLNFGKKGNLSEASENKNFHLIIESAENLVLEVDRLDYIFIVPEEKLNFREVLNLFKKFKSRLLLISSVELYDGESASDDLKWLKETEVEFAQVAKQDNLNARILRFAPLYGPRMSFDLTVAGMDPVIRLIQQSLTGSLQKDASLEFSSRAVFVSDACDLAIKCILSGATAQKIFDGALPAPVKVSEIRQVLLDPVWYENKNFTPQELPPWPTPNLEKTIRFLNWHPTHKLVENLRITLNYFKNNEIKVPEATPEEDKNWKEGKAGELEGLKKGVEKIERGKKDAGIKAGKFTFPAKKFLYAAAFAFTFYALIWPLMQMGWGIAFFRFQLLSAINSLEKGEFEKSLLSVQQANAGVEVAKSVFYSLEPIRKTGVLGEQFESGDNLVKLATYSADAAQNTILGIKSLYQSLKSITGESSESPKEHFDLSGVYLAAADENLSKAYALINSEDFKSNLPEILQPRVDSLSERLLLYSNLVKKGRALSFMMPEVVALSGSKSYLVLLQNNFELRPGGGFIGSYGKVSFEGGKLKDFQVNDIYAIDGQLNFHVEPPKEIKEDLDQKDYYLRDSNWEPDFPTSARVAQWFYNQETGERVEGVVAIDISAIEDLLLSLGSLDLPDYNEKITSDNLFEKAVSMSEVNFFPGTQAKKSFLTSLTSSLFNKLFFLPNQNWPGIVTSLGRSLERKHMSIYLDDPKLFSFAIAQNWGSVLPRGTGPGEALPSDFLAPVEANLGANKANYYIDRNYHLETVIGKEGDVAHRLRIAYTNRSPSNTFPAGTYKNRMRVYLPLGTKLNRLLWGESDITQDADSFTDYGRSGYSFLIELAPKQQKTLVLDYQIPWELEFVDGTAGYRLDVIKQAGTIQDPFVWTVSYPINVRLVSDQADKIGPQEYSIQTDLSKNRTFQLNFSRP